MSSRSTSVVEVVGEKVGILISGIGIGYLVAVDAAGGDEVSSVGLVTVTVGIVLAAYFRRRTG